jgi:hypothetical protein
MIQKVTIGQIYVNAADKSGKALVNPRTGVPQRKIDIYAAGLPEGVKSVSGFVDAESPACLWKAGEEHTVRLLKSKDGKWWNFSSPTENELKLAELEVRIAKLEDQMLGVTREQREVRGVGISVAPKKAVKKQLTEDEEIERLNAEMNELPQL